MVYAEQSSDYAGVLEVMERADKHCEPVPRALLQRTISASLLGETELTLRGCGSIEYHGATWETF